MRIDTEKALPFDGFIEYLKTHGFIIGVDHYLRLQAVLKTFGPDSRPHDLKYLLCPIFAKDKKEQEQFYRLFDSYFRIFVPEEEKISEKTFEKKEKSEALISPDMPAPRKMPYVLFGILLLSLAALLAQWQVNYKIQLEEKQPTQKYMTVSQVDTNEVYTVPPKIKEITATLHIPPPPPPQPITFFQRYGEWIRWIFAITPLILLILILLYQHRRKRLVLLRQRGKRPPYVWPIRVEPQEPRFVKNPQFFSASRHLRQRLQTDVYRLDIEKTIDETIEKSGYPAFCYRAVTRPPEYLVLIDISGQKDHFARYAESITKVLDKEGIFVSHYFYKNDPMVCFRELEGKREYEDLSVLQTRFRNCRLIIFSTGEGLLDPVTGELLPWEGQSLSAWKERAIMTPKQPKEWGIHEKVLSKEFIIVPATSQGLEALARSFNNGDHHDLREWIRRDTLSPVPDADAIHETERLRSFCPSEDTFQWLCACAVYPELDWDLTLHLRSCINESPAREEQVLTLIRLPWFREGAIPNNDRFLLLRELDKERLQSVQESIFHVLEENPPPRDSFAYDGYRLNLFAHRRVLKRMTRKQLRELRRAIKGTDEERIMQDYTLMALLESSRISPLGLILPKALHKIFFRHGLPFLGLKSFVLILFALILSLSAFWLIKTPEAPVMEPPKDIQFEFVSIPPGTFMMGSPEDEKGRYEDETLHRVTLTSGFYMQKTEVTQGQWKAVMGSNPSHFSDCGDDCPVEKVSWDDAQKFIEKLNNIDKEGKYRLPTEAEWEYACRAGSTTAFANGDITELYCDLDVNLDKMGWYCGNSKDKTHRVGEKEPNAWGLYDMHGNVYEWCHDWYGEYEVKGSRGQRIKTNESNIYEVKDPTGPSEGSYRVIRCGNYGGNARICRSAKRFDLPPGYRYDFLGFRLVRSLH